MTETNRAERMTLFLLEMDEVAQEVRRIQIETAQARLARRLGLRLEYLQRYFVEFQAEMLEGKNK